MNFETLKLGFESYLLKLEDPENGKMYDISDTDKSIFKYAKEFRDYLKTSDDMAEFRQSLKEDGESDFALFSMSLTEIKERIKEEGFKDPKLEEDKETDEADDSENIENEEDLENLEEEPQETPEEESEYDLFMGIIGDLLKDDEIRALVDKDGIEGVSEEELFDFLDTIRSYDGDDDNISMEDIVSIAVDVEEDNLLIVPKEDTVQERTKPKGPSYYPTTRTKRATRTPDDMNQEELKEAHTTAQSNLESNKTLLENIKNDSPDSPLYQGKLDMDNAYLLYQEALKAISPDLAQSLETLKTNIANQEKLISDKKQEYTNEQCAYSSAKSSYDSALATIERLSNIDTTELDTQQSSNITSAIESAQKAKNEAYEEMQRAQKRVEEIPEEQQDLEAVLSGYKSDMETLESTILVKNSDIETLMQDYNDKKRAYDEAKAKALEEAQSAVLNSQNYMNDVNSAISEYCAEFSEKILSGNIGEEIIEFAKQYDGKSASEMYQIMKEKGYQFDSGAWCADFTSFCFGMVIGEKFLPDWYRDINRAWCQSLMTNGKGQGIDFKDAQKGDLVMLGVGGTGNEHAAIFAGWADEEHNAYYTVERCGVHGYDGVGMRKRTISSGDVGAIYRMTIVLDSENALEDINQFKYSEEE